MQQRLGRYELIERIASGGQGTVYRARDTMLDRVVAIKVINQPVADDPAYLEALQREASLAGGLDHPNITTVYDFQVQDETAFIVMAYMPDSLDNHLQNGQILPYKRAVEIAVQICCALQHAHENGVVHRDIKPQNILLTDDADVRVSDFGIARALASSTRSQATSNMGTPYYMSPEQWNAERVDGRADIYSTGFLLYQMLTGEVPFRAEAVPAIYIQHLNAPVPELSRVLAVPNSVETVLRTAMEKLPENRYQTANDMLQALERSIEEEMVSGNISGPKLEEDHTVGLFRTFTLAGSTGGVNHKWLISGGIITITLLIIVIGAVLWTSADGLGNDDRGLISIVVPTREPTPTHAPTDTPSPTATNVPTPTRQPIITNTPIVPTSTPFMVVVTATPRPTYTPYPTATRRPTPVPRPTFTPVPTWTPMPTFTPLPPPTPTQIPYQPHVVTGTATINGFWELGSVVTAWSGSTRLGYAVVSRGAKYHMEISRPPDWEPWSYYRHVVTFRINGLETKTLIISNILGV